jgi:hypothetical protein
MIYNSSEQSPNSSYSYTNLLGNVKIFYPDNRGGSRIGGAYLSATIGGLTPQLTAILTR